MAQAASFSFSGNFLQDDNVQLLTLSVTAPSAVTFVTHSYAGGVSSTGASIMAGGFDPSLALFSNTGSLLNSNEDGTCSQVGTAPGTGLCFDSFLQVSLTPGTYTLALTEFDNGAKGSNLAAGFLRQGTGNFTGPAFGPPGATGAFYDLFGNQRNSTWQVDILNVSSAALTSPVPEPATWAFATLAFAAAAAVRRRFKA